jgi:hypothetical protein
MTYQAQPHTYYAGSGTHALLELKTRFEGVLLGWLAYRAGRNFYNVHPNLEDAAIHGAHALRRWWVWLFFIKVWLFSAAFILWMYYLRLHDNATGPGSDFIINDADHSKIVSNGLFFLIPAFVALLITYCRNIDYSLFKRRLVYKVLRPLTVVLTWVPNWLLYLTIPCILMFPF